MGHVLFSGTSSLRSSICSTRSQTVTSPTQGLFWDLVEGKRLGTCFTQCVVIPKLQEACFHLLAIFQIHLCVGNAAYNPRQSFAPNLAWGGILAKAGGGTGVHPPRFASYNSPHKEEMGTWPEKGANTGGA
jgi:hypothetical protein